MYKTKHFKRAANAERCSDENSEAFNPFIGGMSGESSFSIFDFK